MNRPLLAQGLDALAADPVLAALVQAKPQLPYRPAGWTSLAIALERYLGELELWNPKLGLVEADDDAMVTKHVLDCLAAFPRLLATIDRLGADAGPDGAATIRLADIGSGAGLPGIILSLALRELTAYRFSMCLVEKQQRRVGFLLNAKALLGLGMVEILQENLSAVGQVRGGCFDLVTARAFRPLEPGILGELRMLLAEPAWLFLYKGRAERIEEELSAAGLAREGAGVEVLPLSVPGLAEERHIVLIPKN